MAKKPALGRGLSALLPDTPSFEAPRNGERVQELPLSQIYANPAQPRKVFDEEKLAELAESIRQHGVMQPILLVEDGKGGYMIAAGDRRWRADQVAGLTHAPAIVRQLDQQHLAELALIENIQREDLTALEEAEAFQRLMESHGYTQEDLASRLGKSRSHVANTLRLLNLAPHEKKLLAAGKFTAGHARAVLSLENASNERVLLISAIIKQSLSVRQAEELAQKLKLSPGYHQPKKQTATLLHEDIARSLSQQMGVKVKITGRAGKGRVVIDYNSEDDLQNIMDAILS